MPDTDSSLFGPHRLRPDEGKLPAGGGVTREQFMAMLLNKFGGIGAETAVQALTDILEGFAPDLVGALKLDQILSWSYGTTPEAQGLQQAFRAATKQSRAEMGQKLLSKFGIQQPWGAQVGGAAMALARMTGRTDLLAMSFPEQLIDSKSAVQAYIGKGGNIRDTKAFEKFLQTDIFGVQTDIPRQLLVDVYASAVGQFGKTTTVVDALMISTAADLGAAGYGMGTFAEMAHATTSYGRMAMTKAGALNIMHDYSVMKLLASQTGAGFKDVQAIAQVIQQQYGIESHAALSSGLLGLAAGAGLADKSPMKEKLQRAGVEAYATTESDNLKLLAALYERGDVKIKSYIATALEQGDVGTISKLIESGKKDPVARQLRNYTDVAAFKSLMTTKGQLTMMKAEVKQYAGAIRGSAGAEVRALLAGEAVGGKTLNERIKTNDWSRLSNRTRSYFSDLGPTQGRLRAVSRGMQYSGINEADLKRIIDMGRARGSMQTIPDVISDIISEVGAKVKGVFESASSAVQGWLGLDKDAAPSEKPATGSVSVNQTYRAPRPMLEGPSTAWDTGRTEWGMA